MNGPCNNIFYVKGGKVLRYAPTGNCITQFPASKDFCDGTAQSKTTPKLPSRPGRRGLQHRSLRVTTQSRRDADFCVQVRHKILWRAKLPHSSFEIIFGQITTLCDLSGRRVMPVTVSLRSGGGLLDDGYLMGEHFVREV